MHPFDQDTAVTRTAAGRYAATLSTNYWVHRGPNGGYVAAIILRAALEHLGELGHVDRSPRSLTVHYTAPGREGPVDVHVSEERSGGSLSNLLVRLTQQDRLVALALCACSTARPGPEFRDATMPAVPPRADVPRWEHEHPSAVTQNFSYYRCIGGAPFGGGEVAVTGGWIATDPARPLDHVLLAMFTDAWMPALFTKSGLVGVPTIDLTVHFREPVSVPDAPPPDHSLAVFRTNVAADGFIEEDGELWSADGRLLAQSRQLAALIV